MNELKLILGTIAINMDKNPRKKYDDKCFKSPIAFYHHLEMSVETPCTNHVPQLGVKPAITAGLSTLLYQNDFSQLFEVVAEINSIFPKNQSIRDFKYILTKLRTFVNHVEFCTQERLTELQDSKTSSITKQIKKEPVKMSEQINDNTVIIKDRAILDKVRSSYNISDEEFWLLGAVVCIPVTTSIQVGILTQGIAAKILAGGSEHQRIYLTHREICFGVGYEKAIKLMTLPMEVNIDKPVPDFSNAPIDKTGSKATFQINNESLTDFHIFELGKLPVNVEKDKDLVIESFITFVKQELSEDHESDVNTGLEILQNYFTADELFTKLTGCDLVAGHQFLKLRNVSGISLKELVSHVITVERETQKCNHDLPDLDNGALFIVINKENLEPSVCEPCEAWIMNNKLAVRTYSPTQEALKTKRLDYTAGDNSNTVNIKPVVNGNWGNVVKGILKIFDERIKEQEAKTEKSFSEIINQIRNGEISYDKVKEVLTFLNIHAKNKYDTKCIIKALGGIPAVKEAIGITLEDMDEKECIAILKFQIALYQQAAGKFESQQNKIRDQLGDRLNEFWKEAITYHANTGTPGISRHYKDCAMEMKVVCYLEQDRFGFPMWKTRVEVIRSKHFASSRGTIFSGLQFSSDKEYRKQILMKLFPVQQ